ncbi:MAG TPA: EAL domain-containing protein [Ilumatobacteraceae bacterium]|nr:EAL domain-containing protein [Ilumatobacteraceae bacterium]
MEIEPMTSTWSRRYFALGVLLTIAYFLLPADTAKLAIWPILGLSAVIGIVAGVWLNHPKARFAWYLLAAGAASLNIGDDLESIRSFVQHSETSFPYTDVAYAAMYVFLIAGLAILVHRRSHGRDRNTLIDTCIITAGFGLVWWVLLLAPYFRSGDLSLLDRLTSVAYPIGDFVILATAVRLVVGGGRRPSAFWLLLGGLFMLMSADGLFGYLSISAQFSEHSIIDVGWIAFYVGLGAAALHPSMPDLSTATVTEQTVSTGRLVVVASAVVLAPAMLFVQDALGTVSDATPIAITGAFLVALVLVRIIGLVRGAAELKSEARFRALVDKSSDAIVVVDGDARIQYHTPSTEALLGRRSAELNGMKLTDLLAPSDEQRLRVILSEHSRTTNVEWHIRHADGGWRDLEVIVVDLRGTADIDGIVVTMRDITKRKQLDVELRHQALHDSLTGLPNRLLFADRVDQALNRARRENSTVAVLFLDLDDFKMVNDSLGHAAGDEVLVAVAKRLLTAIRSGDSAARLGGDEFGFLLEVGNVDDGARLTALRIEEALQAPFVVGNKEILLHASIGIAVGSPLTHTYDDLLRDADLAMYVAKRRGKGRFELFHPTMHEDATHRLQVAAELLGGMDRGEFVAHYQPIVDIRSRGIVGAEALVRWQHPTRGLLMPDQFIPVAEETGLINALDGWMLNEACRQAKAWRDAELTDESFYMSVNISARHLQQPSVAEDIRVALAASGLLPSRLVLEITETALIDDVDSATAILSDLKRVGARIAVDDFGTGYSSLTHLISFPVDIIKIDKSFVDRVVSGGGGDVMVRAVVDLAHTLGLTAIAEGVEEPEQAQALEDLDCRLAQGYLFSRPVPASVMAALLQVDQLVERV